MIINLVEDASVSSAPSGVAAAIRAAVQAAAQVYEQDFPGNYTVNITYGWGTIDNSVFPLLTNANEGRGGPDSYDYTVTYDKLRSWLAAAGDPAFLPASTKDFPGNANLFAVTSAQEKALGHFSGDPNSVDGSIGFGTAMTGGFEAVALTEIGHALGWITAGGLIEPTITDLFRFSASNKWEWTAGQPAYFSIDDGQTKLADFATSFDPTLFTDSPQGHDDPFAYQVNVNTNALTDLDKQMFHAIGFGLNPGAVTPGLTLIQSGATQTSSLQTQAGLLQPANCSIAAGSNSIITVANDEIQIWNKTLAQQLSGGPSNSSNTLEHFFGLPNSANLFDASVTYDQFNNHFIVVACQGKDDPGSILHIAVSKDSNPNDGWYQYSVNTLIPLQPIGGGEWFDHPQIAIDPTTLYVQGNEVPPSGLGPESSTLYAFPLNSIEAGQTPPTRSYTTDALGINAGLGSSHPDFQYVPAHMYGKQPGLNGDFLVNFSLYFGNDHLYVVEVSNAAQGTPATSFHDVNVGNISDAEPAPARQPDTSNRLDVGDQVSGFATDILAAVWREFPAPGSPTGFTSKLYAVNDIQIGSGSTAHDVVHWFVVDTTDPKNLTLAGQGNIDLDNDVDTYYGNLTVDSAGNIIVEYSVSGLHQYASAAYTMLTPTAGGGWAVGPANYFAPPPGSSQAAYNHPAPTNSPWGQSSGIAVDPSDNGSFWVFNQYATNTNSWATEIGGYVVPSLSALPVTPSALGILQQGIQAFSNFPEATSEAAAINAVPVGDTVTSYAAKLISNNQALSQVAMGVDALMSGAVDNVAEFAKLATVFLPPQLAVAFQAGFNSTVYDAEALGLALAGGNGSSNAFATNFGPLSVSGFAQATAAVTGVNASAIEGFANNWIHFYNANPTATQGLSVTLASYGAAFGDAVGVALLNPTAAQLQSLVPNALIDNAEGILFVGLPLASQPIAKPLEGSFTDALPGVQLQGQSLTSLDHFA